MSFTWMINQETQSEPWQCPNDYVAVAKQRGWMETEAPDTSLNGLFDPPPAPTVTDPVAAQTHFDPNDHTADEALAYIEQHRASSPGEVTRAVEMERAGKARKTILAATDAAVDTPDAVGGTQNG